MLQEDFEAASAAYAPPGKRDVRDQSGNLIWEEVPVSELGDLGLSESMLEPDNSEFRAVVLRKPGTKEVVVSFKGTTSWLDGFGFGQDMVNNKQQAFGETSDYYSRAQLIARNIQAKAEKSGTSVKFVGHSLGGGLASAAAHSSGLPASTFNAAGLHDLNMQPSQSDYDAPKIDAVRVDGEILTAIQSVGKKLGVVPDAAGTPFPVKPASGLSRVFDLAKYGAMAPIIPVMGNVLFGAAALARAGYLHTSGAIRGALSSRMDDVEARRTQLYGCTC